MLLYGLHDKLRMSRRVYSIFLHPENATRIAANIALIAAGFLVLIQDFRGELITSASPGTRSAPAVHYAAGEVMTSIAGVDFTASTATVLLALRSDCRFCTASMPFYQRLLNTRPEGARIVVLSAESAPKSRAYLAQHGMTVDEIVIGPFPGLKISSTPRSCWSIGEVKLPEYGPVFLRRPVSWKS